MWCPVYCVVLYSFLWCAITLYLAKKIPHVWVYIICYMLYANHKTNLISLWHLHSILFLFLIIFFLIPLLYFGYNQSYSASTLGLYMFKVPKNWWKMWIRVLPRLFKQSWIDVTITLSFSNFYNCILFFFFFYLTIKLHIFLQSIKWLTKQPYRMILKLTLLEPAIPHVS